MYQHNQQPHVAQVPPEDSSPASAAVPPPKRSMPTWTRTVIIAAVGLCILSGSVLAIDLTHAVPLLSSSSSSSPTLPASVGESLTINHLTVTLTSAKAVPLLGEVKFSLHVWNQTSSAHILSMASWYLFTNGGADWYSLSADDGILSTANLQPNETQDKYVTVRLNPDDQGPFTLRSNYTSAQGQPLAWRFTG